MRETGRVKAIQIKEFGGPEVLEHTEIPDPEPGEGQVLVDVARAGINFADTHVTRNDYLAEQQLPLIPGGEISGRTPDGRRVAALLMNGGYAEKVAVPEPALVPGEEPGALPCSSRSGPAPGA
jgi:NADPH:quinone reductase